MTSPKPVVGDIWLAYLEFSDHPGVGKVRPVLVVDVEGDACIVVVAKVTSKDLRESSNVPCLPIINWNRYGLVKPSYIRLDQRFELAYERLLRDAPIGRLPRSLMDVVADALDEIG